jgi:ribosomal protein S18 acetylase RimI-like enzyme
MSDITSALPKMTQQTDYGIRKAILADAPRIARMHVASWLETYKEIVPEEILATLSVSRRTAAWEQILRDPIKNDKSVVYLREIGDEIAGFGACSEQRDADLRIRGFDGEIGSVYVLRSFQRQGIGQALMGAIASDLISRGFRGAALWVLRDNAPARRFYERCAGEVIAEQKDVRGEAVLVEVAYGWHDIEVLRQHVHIR